MQILTLYGYYIIMYSVYISKIQGMVGTKKSLMIKYGRMQKEIPSRLVRGSFGMCLDCMLLGVQVTTGLGFFTVFRSFSL